VHPPPPGPPPDWYPDPYGEKAWRWWDGSTWTGLASDPSLPNPPPGSAYPAASTNPWQPAGLAHVPWDRLTAEERMAPWAVRAMFVYPLVRIISTIRAWATRADTRRSYHDLRVLFDTGHAPVRTRTPASPGTASLLLLIVALSIGTYVVFLIWQHRAATTARFLGLPAAHSPALGVGSWFIPIVNLWFPYQALRDCLPPGHPVRSTVLRMWLLFLASYVTGVATGILVVVGDVAGAVATAIDLLVTVAFAVAAVRMVQGITAAHREALQVGGPTAIAP
jgi:hypothetical protein